VRDDQWVNTLPDLNEHLSTYRSTIRALKKFADGRGKPILFVTQPYVWSSNMTAEAKRQIYAGFIGPSNGPDAKWYTMAALERGLSAYNQTLLETCHSDHLLCVDAAGKIPRAAEYFIDDFHFSGAGANMIADLVANAIEGETAMCR
jgi:lysophospholipase L1-like esterase